MMNYTQALEYIHNMPKFVRGTGNDELKRLLFYLNNPENNLKFVHIAGTNGKGSTAFMLAEILKLSGYKTGLFTSPYIEQFNERFQINNKMISDNCLASLISDIKEIIISNNIKIPEFALNTAAAFYWFNKNKCDIVMLETGLGGKLDSTNIIKSPLVSVLTAIDFDHTQYLGKTISEIAEEKCGIIKDNCPIVVYPIQHKNVFDTINKFAKKNNSTVHIADIPTICDDNIIISNKKYTLGLKGKFQAFNAAVVVKTIDVLRQLGYNITTEEIKLGLNTAKNPGRFEKFGPRIILDGAHNPHAIKALCNELSELNKPIYFCVAMMEDKDFAKCAEIIAPEGKGIVTTQLNIPRFCSAETLANEFIKHNKNVFINSNPISAMNEILRIAEKDSIICVCGSIYLAGEIRKHIKLFT